MDDLKNKRVTVAGLGRFGGGIAAAQWLTRQGARVLVTDTASTDALKDSIKQLDGYDVQFRLGGHDRAHFTDADLIVASPAIPPDNPYLIAAREAGVPITTEICLFLERCPLPVVAVSGTKGKSTTSKLLTLMLETRYRVWLGGNIGKSLLFDLPSMKEGQIVLLELSSFMLEYLGKIHFSPHVALLTMLGSDHLEWHKTQDAYLSAKRNLVARQKPTDFAVMGESCELARQFAAATQAKVLWYGLDGRKPFELSIPGQHNQLNAQAAFVAAGSMGVDWDSAQRAVRDFKGLPHRLQLVHEWQGVRFYDDSIATIPLAAAAALQAFPAGKVIQIVGGHDKGLPYAPMCDAIARHARAMVCIGDAKEARAQILKTIRADHPEFTAIHDAGTIEVAMSQIRSIASPGDIVLLSTGCSSYDQFTNFQQRGLKFAELARQFFV